MIGGLFDVRVIRHKRPDSRADLAPMASKKDIPAMLAVQKFQYARTARTRPCRPVKKPADQNISFGSGHFRTCGVAARPHALDVPEKHMRPQWQQWSVLRIGSTCY